MVPDAGHARAAYPRERATSKFCTTIRYATLAATVYLAMMGGGGCGASRNVELANRAATALRPPGCRPRFGAPFFNDVVVKTDDTAARSRGERAESWLHSRRQLLAPSLKERCWSGVTEMNTQSEFERLAGGALRNSCWS